MNEASEARLERVTAEPGALLAASVSHLHDATRLIDDEAADAVDLRLAGEAIRVGDGLTQRAHAVVSDELRDDTREHACIVAADPTRPDMREAASWP